MQQQLLIATPLTTATTTRTHISGVDHRKATGTQNNITYHWQGQRQNDDGNGKSVMADIDGSMHLPNNNQPTLVIGLVIHPHHCVTLFIDELRPRFSAFRWLDQLRRDVVKLTGKLNGAYRLAARNRLGPLANVLGHPEAPLQYKKSMLVPLCSVHGMETLLGWPHATNCKMPHTAWAMKVVPSLMRQRSCLFL
eukprot:scaffold223774_cov18-Prasinocladus_malaysianus.AAC.2